MWAGKSLNLVSEVERYRVSQKSCVIIKYSEDTRYDNQAKNGGIVTHGKQEYFSVPIIKTKTLTEIYDKILIYDVAAIDEFQFMPDCVEIVQNLANNGKIVICSGLDANFLGKPFGRIGEMVAIAEDVIKLKAICMNCHDNASFTCKIAGTKEEIEIGEENLYKAMCRTCLYNNLPK
jgi:thymidine kinase